MPDPDGIADPPELVNCCVDDCDIFGSARRLFRRYRSGDGLVGDDALAGGARDSPNPDPVIIVESGR